MNKSNVYADSQLRMLAKKLQEKFPNLISDVRGWGLIIGLEIAPSCDFGAAEVGLQFVEYSIFLLSSHFPPPPPPHLIMSSPMTLSALHRIHSYLS